MTNREKFVDQLLDHLEKYGSRPAMFNGEFVPCRDINCRDCDFNAHGEECTTKFMEWFKSEYYTKPDIPLDTPIDTPIMVWDRSDSVKQRRYFAGFSNRYGYYMVMAWDNGKTSWTAYDRYDLWEHAELADEN